MLYLCNCVCVTREVRTLSCETVELCASWLMPNFPGHLESYICWRFKPNIRDIFNQDLSLSGNSKACNFPARNSSEVHSACLLIKPYLSACGKEFMLVDVYTKVKLFAVYTSNIQNTRWRFVICISTVPCKSLETFEFPLLLFSFHPFC